MNTQENNNSNSNWNKRSYLKVGILVIIITVIIIALIFYGGMLRSAEPEWIILEPENGEIRINYSDIADGELHFFKIKNSDNGFFVFKNPYNQIKTRISICEPCEGDTFHIEDNGKIIVCNKCSTKWDTKNFKGISGGCINDPPPELNHYEDSGFIIIKETDL